MKKKLFYATSIALVLGVLALAAGVIWAPSSASAQTPDTTSMAGKVEHIFRGMRDVMDQFLAEELGITVEELQAARERAADRALDYAVEQGRLTQEQADLMRARHAMKTYVDPQAVLAEQLGITVEELQAARENGTLRDLLADLDRDALRDAMKAAWNAAIDQAVADGAISEDVAEQLRDRGPGFGGKFGHGRGRGRHGSKPAPGRGFGAPGFGFDG
nr:hypothetical protein [Ardenticatena sp.]